MKPIFRHITNPINQSTRKNIGGSWDICLISSDFSKCLDGFIQVFYKSSPNHHWMPTLISNYQVKVMWNN